jgi:hypothetical protein
MSYTCGHLSRKSKGGGREAKAKRSANNTLLGCAMEEKDVNAISLCLSLVVERKRVGNWDQAKGPALGAK